MIWDFNAKVTATTPRDSTAAVATGACSTGEPGERHVQEATYLNAAEGALEFIDLQRAISPKARTARGSYCMGPGGSPKDRPTTR